MNQTNNILLSTDSYKISHYKQYPKGTEHIYSYIEPRSGAGDIVIFGIDRFVKLLQNAVTLENIAELEVVATLHGVPFFKEGWYDLLKDHGPALPVRVQGVPEGTLVKAGTPVCSIVNTDPKYPWITSFLETLFIRCVWYPSTIASRSRAAKLMIKGYLERTGTPETLPFKLHDFGARGVTCGTQASIGGAAHLISFQGTDTVEALKYIRDNHDCEMPGFSIPATEHSTVTSWGREHEYEMFETFIEENLGEGKIAACVSDSYNIWNAIDAWKELEPKILAKGGTLVIRPDSGDPVQVPIDVVHKCLKLFGYTRNEKGYIVLPDHIRVIQGDGIDPTQMGVILRTLEINGISADNIAFGMGGGLLQRVSRDTYGWAMKCSAACVKGEWRDVYKDPVGGSKPSKPGLVYVNGVTSYLHAGEIIAGPWESSGDWVDYYWNGKTRPADSWDTIRARAE